MRNVPVTRRGFSLPELLVATTIAGIAAALMTGTIVRQQRFYSSANEILEVRAELRDGADVLVSDLRSAATAMYGLPVMTDTAVEMLSVIASSIACSPSGTTIGLPPTILQPAHSLTSILLQPDTGDLALLYSADSAKWQAARIASFASRSVASSCPSSTGFTTPSDATSGSPAYLLTLTATPVAPIRAGAPIHFLRRSRYSFYRSSDGEWYLGYRRCGVTSPYGCAAIQPVSGPYRAPRTGSSGGLSFRYYDASNVQLTGPAQSNRVARIDIILRGESDGLIALTGDSRKVWRDSVLVSVAPRNAMR